jgi:hypothetical protein
MLQYFEQGGVHNLIDFKKDIYDEATNGARLVGAKPAIFLCPSDPQQGHGTLYGWTSYHANAGSWVRLGGWDGVFGPAGMEAARDGIPSLKLSEIPDGTSNTAAFSEVPNGLYADDAGPVATGAADPKHDCFEFGGMPTGNYAQVRDAFLAKSWTTAVVPWDGTWRDRGYPWFEGSVWRTWYNHLLPPNSTCWRPEAGNLFSDIVSPAGSSHSGVVLSVFVDGSVQQIADGIDPVVWVENGTRDVFDLNAVASRR